MIKLVKERDYVVDVHVEGEEAATFVYHGQDASGLYLFLSRTSEYCYLFTREEVARFVEVIQ